MPGTTTEQILAAILGITYTGTPTKKRVIMLHDTDFEDFTQYPLLVVASGDETIDPRANSEAASDFLPEVHFFIENTSSTTLEGWRESIRNNIMNSKTLRDLSTGINITGITLDEQEEGKRQHLTFELSIPFDKPYVVA